MLIREYNWIDFSLEKLRSAVATPTDIVLKTLSAVQGLEIIP